MKDSHIKDLLSKFLQLDKNGLANCDLQSGNIFLLNNGKTKLIDFGSFSILNNEGYTSASDYIPGELFKQNQEFLQYINKPIKEKLARTFFNPTADDIKNLSDNPYLNIMSNTSNFEFRTLYKHLLSGNESNPLEFFRNYIKNKGEIYHGNMEEFLKSIDIDKVVLTSDKKEAIEVAKTGLKKAINYENLAKEVFENPTDEVLKTELGKIQLKTFLNPDSLGSPIPSSKKIQSAYTQLTSLLQNNIENSQGSQKEYYMETLKCLENRFKDFRFEAGQVDIPENENLITKLFEKIKPEDKIDDLVNTVKKNNKKVYLFIAAGLALIGIGGVCLYKKKKTKLPNTNNVQPYTFANNTISQGFNTNKTTSNIFANFN